MYATCAFCNSSLGGDGGASGLGVGRRFAYDGWRVRAWVVCGKCSRWNLTPFDTRETAIAALDAMADGGRQAATSEQVTLIRAADGCDVVRIGQPRRPELATWRYGERLKARQREMLRIYVPVAVVTVGATLAMNAAAGGGLAAFWGNLPGIIDGTTTWVVGRGRVAVEPPVCDRCGKVMVLRARHVEYARLTRTAQHDLGLIVSCPSCRSEGAMLTGPDAERALRTGMTFLNLKRKKKVKKQAAAAAEYLERHGGPESYVANTVRLERTLGQLAGTETLALEMAVDEQAELRELERQWHEAEELANIADSLLIDPDVDEALKKKRGGG